MCIRDRERVGAYRESLKEKSITGGCASNEGVRRAEWESCNWTESEFAFRRRGRLNGGRSTRVSSVFYLTLLLGVLVAFRALRWELAKGPKVGFHLVLTLK